MTGIIFNQLSDEFTRIFVPTACFGLLLISLATLLTAISAALRSHANSSKTAPAAILRWIVAILLLIAAIGIMDAITPIWKYYLQIPDPTRRTILATFALLYTAPPFITMLSIARGVVSQVGRASA